jgi:ankyrin repeat protein
LIDHERINVNATLSSKKTPLHLAASRNYTEIVSILLRHPMIDVNARDWYDRTPIFTTLEWVAVSALKALLHSEHVDVNLVDQRGRKVEDYLLDGRGHSVLDPLSVGHWYGDDRDDILRLIRAHPTYKGPLDLVVGPGTS